MKNDFIIVLKNWYWLLDSAIKNKAFRLKKLIWPNFDAT